MLRTILIDDERRARVAIRKALEAAAPGVELVAEADSVESGIAAIKEFRPELVLLDIQMNDGTGFDLLEKLEPVNFKVIFITAYHEHAIQAFRFSAIDYITKPLEVEELGKAVARAQESMNLDEVQFQLAHLKEALEKGNTVQRIAIKGVDKISIVPLSDIIRCEADRNYTQFHLVDGSRTLVAKTLKDYEECLKGHLFMRIHHSHLVNLNHVTSIDRTDGYSVTMSNGSTAPVSVRKRDVLLGYFDNLL